MSEVNSFKINQLQYPKNLNASTNSSPNLRHILDHCCLCQKKMERCSVLHFNITSYLITSHNIQKLWCFSINGNEHGSEEFHKSYCDSKDWNIFAQSRIGQQKGKTKNITQLSKYCWGIQTYCWRTCNECIDYSMGCISNLCILGGDHGISAFHLPPRTVERKRWNQNKKCLNSIKS